MELREKNLKASKIELAANLSADYGRSLRVEEVDAADGNSASSHVGNR